MQALPPTQEFDSFPPAGGAQAWQRTRNLVLVRLDDIGALEAYGPLCHALSDRKRRRVTLLTSKAGVAMRAHLEGVDDVLVYEAPWVDGRLRSGAADRRFLGKLASCRFDGAILCTPGAQSSLPAALFCRMAGIPLRLAYSRENPYGLLTDWVAEPDSVDARAAEADPPFTTRSPDIVRQMELVRSVGFDVPEDGALAGNEPAGHEAARRSRQQMQFVD